MQYKIPNLAALTHFEAAGRYQSFTLAANELCVTQGAVSRQIKLLEVSLGFKLFVRKHRAIEFTEEGRAFYRVVSTSLHQVSQAAHDIRETVSPDSVTIATTYAVSVYWLMPLMPALRAAFPGVNIKVLSADAIASIEGQFDVAIRYGDGHWFGYDAVSLGATAVYPVCSPHYPGIDQIAKPADLACQSLLYLDDGRKNWMDWRDWFQSAGVSAALPVPVLRANSYIVLLQAAISGQGIALGWEQLVSEMLESGVLTRVVDVTVDTPQHFYLLRAREERSRACVDDICQWMHKAFSRTQV